MSRGLSEENDLRQAIGVFNADFRRGNDVGTIDFVFTQAIVATTDALSGFPENLRPMCVADKVKVDQINTITT